MVWTQAWRAFGQVPLHTSYPEHAETELVRRADPRLRGAPAELMLTHVALPFPYAARLGALNEMQPSCLMSALSQLQMKALRYPTASRAAVDGEGMWFVPMVVSCFGAEVAEFNVNLDLM